MHGCWYIREPRLRAIGRFRIPGTGLRILCQWHLDSAFFELYSGFPTAPPPPTPHQKNSPAWLKAYFLLLRKAPAQRSNIFALRCIGHLLWLNEQAIASDV